MPSASRNQGRISRDSPGTSSPGTTESVSEILARVAAPREGVFRRQRAIDAGISDNILDYRLKHGGLYPMYTGVHAVGVRPTHDLAWFFAALEAAGDDARISHLTALRYWRILHFDLHPIHITIPRSQRLDRKGITPHRPVDQHPWDYADLDGLRIASVQRALLDSTPYLTDNQLALAVHKVKVEHRIELASLQRTIDRAPHARGRNRLHVVAFGKQLPPGRLERRLRYLVGKAHLPDYERNVFVHGFLVDAYWPEHNLVYEVDDNSHLTKHRAERDQDMTTTLEDRGIRVRRVTEHDLYPHARRTIRRLANQLGV